MPHTPSTLARYPRKHATRATHSSMPYTQTRKARHFSKSIDLGSHTFYFHKQVESGLSPQSCSYFQGCQDSKLLNDCLVLWPSNLCLWRRQWFPGFKIDIFEFWCIVGLTAILRLLQRKNSFFLICSFYCC